MLPKLPAEPAPPVLDNLDAGGTRAGAGGLEGHQRLFQASQERVPEATVWPQVMHSL